MGKRVTLEPFIERVRRCQKCQRFGHLARFYRFYAGAPVCVRCGLDAALSSHDNEKCRSESPRCINCVRHRLDKVDHEASNPKCPIYLKQRKINKIVAYNKVSPTEAKALLDKGIENPQGGWSRPSLGVPVPTLHHDFIPNNIKNQISFKTGSAKKNRRSSMTVSHGQTGSPHTSPSPSFFPSVPPLSVPFTTSASSSSEAHMHAITSPQLPPVFSPLPPLALADAGCSARSRSSGPRLHSDPSFPINLVEHNSNNYQHLKSGNLRRKNISKTTNNNIGGQNTSNSDYKSLNPPPELLKNWILECKKKYTILNTLQQEMMLEIGNSLLKSAMCT